MLRCIICIAFLLVIATAPSTTGAEPPLVPRDNDHPSWARQVFPVLYGRKAKGYSEIKVIADLAAQVGRGPVLDALMQSDEFIEHWAEVLTEHLRAPRLGDKSLSSCYAPTGNTAAQGDALARWIRDRGPRERFESAAVFNMGDVVRSSLRLDDLSPVLIAHSFALVSRPLQGNMIKERQIQDDFLATFENVYLHRKTSCLICHNSSYSVTGRSSFWSRTHPIPGHFEEALLGSRTGPAFPQTLSTFLRWKDVVSSDPGSVAPWGLSGCGTFKPADAVDPELTVDNPVYRPDQPNPNVPPPRLKLEPRLATKSGGIVSIFDVESELRRGFDILRASGILTRKVSPADVAYCQLCQACAGLPEAVVLTPEQQEAERKVLGLLNGRCRQCHGRWTTPGGNITSEDLYERLIRSPALNRESCARVSPGDTAKSYLWEKIRAVSDGDENCSRKDSRMPADGGRYLDGTQEAVLRDWIAGLPVNAGCKACKQRRTDDCPNPGKRAIDPLESFAFMTSVTLVNRVWAEVMGYPLTIPNYFPRSQGQGQRLATLSETVFTTNKFSLKALLREVLVTAPHFNRAPPSRGGPVYEVPLVFDPWIERDPRVPPMANGWPPLPNPAYNPAAHPEHHANAMTEAVRRYPAHALIRSARTALGWPMRPLFFDIGGSSIIDRDLAADTGLFISDAEPGFRGMNLQSLLGWEDRMGACMRPDGVAIDWMDRLLAEIGRINAAAVSRRISRREAAATVKDWLVGDLGISDGAEAGGLAVLLGWSSAGWTEQRFLDADVPSDAPGLATFAAGLRRFCGVLLQTPQFQFGGLAAAELTPPLADPSARDPRLRVCNPGPCQYRELCEVLAGPLRQNGWQVICPPPDSPSAVVAARSAPPSALASAELDALCPRGRCYLMKLPPACSRDIASCAQTLPLCDPSVSTCGNPIDPVGRSRLLSEGAVLVAELEGTRIADARGGLHLRDGNAAFVSVETGRTLKAGEVIKLALGHSLRIERLAPASGGMVQLPEIEPWTLGYGAPTVPQPAGPEITVIVTGPSLRRAMLPERTMTIPPDWTIPALRQDGWRKFGEAGHLSVESDTPRVTDGESLDSRRLRMARERESAERTYRAFQLEHQKRPR